MEPASASTARVDGSVTGTGYFLPFLLEPCSLGVHVDVCGEPHRCETHATIFQHMTHLEHPLWGSMKLGGMQEPSSYDPA